MLPASVRILVCTARQDMRKSFDTLAAVVRDVLGEEPQDGALYVFVGKSPTRVKVLWWDTNGYCLLAKRLHRAFFTVPEAKAGAIKVAIDSDALAQLLAGVVREDKKRAERVH